MEDRIRQNEWLLSHDLVRLTKPLEDIYYPDMDVNLGLYIVGAMFNTVVILLYTYTPNCNCVLLRWRRYPVNLLSFNS